jgi:hypothetical protein
MYFSSNYVQSFSLDSPAIETYPASFNLIIKNMLCQSTIYSPLTRNMFNFVNLNLSISSFSLAHLFTESKLLKLPEICKSLFEHGFEPFSQK